MFTRDGKLISRQATFVTTVAFMAQLITSAHGEPSVRSELQEVGRIEEFIREKVKDNERILKGTMDMELFFSQMAIIGHEIDVELIKVGKNLLQLNESGKSVRLSHYNVTSTLNYTEEIIGELREALGVHGITARSQNSTLTNLNENLRIFENRLEELVGELRSKDERQEEHELITNTHNNTLKDHAEQIAMLWGLLQGPLSLSLAELTGLSIGAAGVTIYLVVGIVNINHNSRKFELELYFVSW